MLKKLSESKSENINIQTWLGIVHYFVNLNLFFFNVKQQLILFNKIIKMWDFIIIHFMTLIVYNDTYHDTLNLNIKWSFDNYFIKNKLKGIIRDNFRDFCM